MRASDFEISNYNKLDKILSKLCEMVVKGKQDRPDYYGMVAAAIVDPSNQIVARLNRPGRDGKRIHAEHAAMLDYNSKYGDIPNGSIVITTLSPCNESMDERDGPSCTELINNSTIKKVYCGYMDPTQDDDTRQFNLMETADQELRNTCKQFADTFLGDVHETQTLEERRKKKRKVRRAAYGPGLYGGYGYFSNYGNSDSASDSGGADGGGESIHELFDGGKDWKWTYQDKNQASAEFVVGDVHYTFMAGQDPDEAPGDWDVEFAAKQSHGTASWGVTGTGNSAQVFGTVVEIMKAFITSKKASIRRMTFAAKEDSRQGLYARMVKRLLPKWNLEQSGEAFVLTRPGGLVFWVYSVEAPYNKIPAVKVKANSAREAEQIVLNTMPEFKGADLMGMGASKNKPNLSENFADGRNPQDKGDSKRHGINTKASVSSLRNTAKQGGRKGQLAHWLANMKAGRAKKK